MLKQRKRAIKARDSEANSRIQTQINKLIRTNQLKAVQNEYRKCKSGTKDWWSNINKITGRNDNKLPVASFIGSSEINGFFHDVCTDPYYNLQSLKKFQKVLEFLCLL